MKIDIYGEKLIKQFESCKLTAYKVDNSEKYYTIGWGHYGTDVKKDMKISKERANELFRNDIKYFETSVNSCLKVKVTQSMFNALVSFTYNVGYSAFKNSTLLKYINKSQFTKASKEFKKWNKCGGKVLKGLVKRRLLEKTEFERQGLAPSYIEVNNFTLPSLRGYKGISIVEGLKKYNYKSDFGYRCKLWEMLGYKEIYIGSKKQNLLLLKKLKSIK